MTAHLIDGPSLCPDHKGIGMLLDPHDLAESGRVLTWRCPGDGRLYARHHTSGAMVALRRLAR